MDVPHLESAEIRTVDAHAFAGALNLAAKACAAGRIAGELVVVAWSTGALADSRHVLDTRLRCGLVPFELHPRALEIARRLADVSTADLVVVLVNDGGVELRRLNGFRPCN
jgi:hypothetical protein